MKSFDFLQYFFLKKVRKENLELNPFEASEPPNFLARTYLLFYALLIATQLSWNKTYLFFYGAALPSGASEPAILFNSLLFIIFCLVDCCAVVSKQMFSFSDAFENINK